jgi:hypothetical protein
MPLSLAHDDPRHDTSCAAAALSNRLLGSSTLLSFCGATSLLLGHGGIGIMTPRSFCAKEDGESAVEGDIKARS